MKPIMSAFLAALFLVVQSHAQSIGRFGNSDYATYQDPVLTFNSYGFPTSPLIAGQKQLKIIPAYVVSSANLGSQNPGDSLDRAPTTGNRTWSENDAKGGGVMFAWLHGLSDHWGYSVSIAYIRLSGKTFAFAEYNAANALVKRHDASESGTALQTTALAIFDPFTDPDGFRLPLFAGYGFLYQDQSAEYTAPSTVLAGAPRIKFNSSFSTVIPGFVFGASAQINTGPLRWTPFFAVQLKNAAPAVDSTVTNEATGALLSRQSFTNGDSFLPAGGLGIVYKPWDLGFTWAPNLNALADPDEDVKHSIFTLSKTFKWGG